MKGFVMLVFEVLQENHEALSGLKTLPNAEVFQIDPLDGAAILQVAVPLVSIVAPLVAHTLQKYFEDNRVTIKYDGVEISAMGYEKAMKLFREVSAQRIEEQGGEPAS
jgi:hypothetical protein